MDIDRFNVSPYFFMAAMPLGGSLYQARDDLAKAEKRLLEAQGALTEATKVVDAVRSSRYSESGASAAGTGAEPGSPSQSSRERR